MTSASRLFLVGALSVVFCAVAQAQVFLRPMAVAYLPEGTDDNEGSSKVDSIVVGGGATFGVFMGPTNRHEVSFEVSSLSIDSKTEGSPASASNKESYLPIMQQYRLHIPLTKKERLWIFLGPAVGIANTEKETLNTQTPGVGVSTRVTKSKWNIAWGASIGVNYRLGNSFDVDIGVRRLQVESKSKKLGWDNFAANGVFAGLGVRF